MKVRRIDTIEIDKAASVLRALGEAGGTAGDADWLQQRANAADVIAFIRRRQRELSILPGTNPFAVPVATLFYRLAQANHVQGWGITESTFERLRMTTPALPEGRLAFLSFRIRFDEGLKGVERTANAHLAEIMRVHGKDNVQRWEHLYACRLRLLVGNDTHTPAVEWCVIDLDTHRKRESIDAVRGPASIADEGLVLAWLYPHYPRGINYLENPAYFLAGYELKLSVGGDAHSNVVPFIGQDRQRDKICLSALWSCHAGPQCSVPTLRT